jgi:hypothetical protein
LIDDCFFRQEDNTKRSNNDASPIQANDSRQSVSRHKKDDTNEKTYEADDSVIKPFYNETESSLSQLSLLKLPESDMLRGVNVCLFLSNVNTSKFFFTREKF